LGSPRSKQPCLAGLVGGARAHGAVVNAQLLEVGEDGEGGLGVPAVTPDLMGGGGVEAQVDPALLGLGVKLELGPDPEGIVRGALAALDVQAVLGHDLAILERGPRLVADVPAQCLEKRIDQGLPDVGFLDAGGEEGFVVGREIGDQRGDFVFASIESFSHDDIIEDLQ
jgi:hypothetical protein